MTLFLALNVRNIELHIAGCKTRNPAAMKYSPPLIPQRFHGGIMPCGETHIDKVAFITIPLNRHEFPGVQEQMETVYTVSGNGGHENGTAECLGSQREHG